jgi:hypothetical protein
LELLPVAPAVFGKEFVFGALPQFLPDRLPKITVHEFEGLFVMNGHTMFVFDHHGIPLSPPGDAELDLSCRQTLAHHRWIELMAKDRKLESNAIYFISTVYNESASSQI